MKVIVGISDEFSIFSAFLWKRNENFSFDVTRKKKQFALEYVL